MSAPVSAAVSSPVSPPAASDPFAAAAERARAKGASINESPSMSATPSFAAEPAPVRRGGVGLIGLVVMGILAAAGGAVGGAVLVSQPQLTRQLGLASVMAPADADLTRRLTAAETDIGTLRQQLARLEARLPAPAANTPSAAIPAPTAATAPPASSGNANRPADAAGTTAAPSAGTTTAAQPAPGAATPQAPASAPVDFAPLRAELAGLAGRITGIETRLAALDPTGAGGAVIASLQTEVATLKVLVDQLQSRTSAAPAPGLTMAVLALTEASNGSAAFLPEFEAIRAAAPDLPGLAALEPLARTGVPTRAQLEQRFVTLQPAVDALVLEAESDGGIAGWFRHLLASLVRVERADVAEGTGPKAALARAKQRMDEGDLAAALREVDTIVPMPDPVRSWATGARARLELEARLAALRVAAQRPQGAPASAQPTAPTAIAPATAPANAVQPAAPSAQTAPAAPAAQTPSQPGAGR